jgi:hypothetical protein
MDISSPNRKAVALLFLVLALGIALGAVGATVVNRHVYAARVRVPNTTRPVTRLTQDLSLSADQVKQVSTILGGMQTKYDEIRQQMSPQFDQVRQQGREQIRELLTPNQRPKFEDFLQRVDEDRKRRAAQNPSPR